MFKHKGDQYLFHASPAMIHAHHHLGMPAIMRQVISLGIPGLVVQSVTYLTADVCLTADPWVIRSIPTRSHTFMEIDHEMISMVILLPSADSRRDVVNKYEHKVLVSRKKSVVR